MDFCNLSKTGNLDYLGYLIYFILLIEYITLLIVLILFIHKSYKDYLLNLKEYRLYLILIILSSLLKISMFFNYCEFNNAYYSIFIIAYELPYYTSLTLLIYLW